MKNVLIGVASVVLMFSCGNFVDGAEEQIGFGNDVERTEYTNRAIATIVDDDIGSVESLETIKSMADRQGIKITFAAITDKLDDYEKKKLLLKYQTEGFHVVSHSKTHRQDIWRKGYATFDIEVIAKEMEDAQYRLRREGFKDCDFLIYPYGAFPEERNIKKQITELAVKRHRAAVNSSTGKANYPPRTERYYLNRILISKNKNIDELKKVIDKEIALKGWIIFLTHSNNANEFSVDYTEEIVKYILSKNIEFMTLAEAWKHKGVLYK